MQKGEIYIKRGGSQHHSVAARKHASARTQRERGEREICTKRGESVKDAACGGNEALLGHEVHSDQFFSHISERQEETPQKRITTAPKKQNKKQHQ